MIRRRSTAAGGSERLVAQAFRERPDLAGDVLVTTKVGHLPGHDGTYDMAMRCVEGSMERLGVERFPLLYIHDPMDMPMGLVMSERGTLGALRTLQKRGLLDYVGVAANDPVTNATYIETGEFDAAVVPEAWSLINRLAEERIFPAAERHGTGLVIATPLGTGAARCGGTGDEYVSASAVLVGGAGARAAAGDRLRASWRLAGGSGSAICGAASGCLCSHRWRPQSAGSAGQRGGDAGANTGGVLGRGATNAPPLGGR